VKFSLPDDLQDLLIVEKFIHHFPETDEQVLEDCRSWIEQQTNQLNSYLNNIAESKELTAATKDAVAAIGNNFPPTFLANVHPLQVIKPDGSTPQKLSKPTTAMDKLTPMWS